VHPVGEFYDAATIAYQDTAVSGQIIEDASEADALAHTWDTLRLALAFHGGSAAERRA
jgi:hypothetical protein